MRRRCAILLLAATPASAQATSWEGPFTLALLTRNLAAVPERRARFTEERRFAALDQPLHSRGTLLWRRPDVLEKVTESPEAETLRIIGDRVEVTASGRATIAISLTSQPQLGTFAEAMRAPLAGDLATLVRLFEVVLTVGPAGWQLRLTPRDGRTRRMVTSLEIAGSLAEPREIRLLMGNGDAQILRIEPLP